jgi:hypothetical protein
VQGSFQVEQLVRLTVLEAPLRAAEARTEQPGHLRPGSREHHRPVARALSFTFWYLVAKKLIMRGDQSRLIITADGVDYLEQNFEASSQLKRLEEQAGTRALASEAG